VYGTLGITSAANRPGSRIYGAGWSDDIGNLYLYGGAGAATSATLGGLSDLWKYSTLTNQWTWIHGTNAFSSQAIRGTRGIAAATNRPAYKSQAAYCKDFQGNFWLFGGYTYDQATSTPGESNDLWKYDPVTNEWTWVAGETFINAYAVYGNKGFPSPANRPAAKSSAVGWADIDGNFWVFGGYGFSQTIQGYVNDLWKYEKDLDQWTWVKGDSTVDTQGNFGVQGVASTLNTPGTKQYARGWTDAVGNFYLFAGSGTASGGTGGYMNDLWKFGPTHTLPVQLVSFCGKRSRAMSTLQWEVEQESNLDRYEVERSFSGNNFDYAGSVKAKGAKSYRYDDRATIFQSRIFYRLKIIDSDNQFRYSKVIALDISPEVSISVYPNPVRSALCVQMNRYIVGTTHITITDAMGRVVFVKEYSGTGNDEQQLWIPVQTWPAGLYSLRIKNNYNEYPLSFVVGAN
jgi:N-acetylneuraminic acid mutarotase